MSELTTPIRIDIPGVGSIESADLYLKSEADKVIAEKDETIDEIKERNDELQKATDSAWSKVNAMYDELSHQKYKLCLAMANGCKDKIKYWHIRYTTASGYDRSYEKWKHRLFKKWLNRWLAIAEKFKPNSTAQ